MKYLSLGVMVGLLVAGLWFGIEGAYNLFAAIVVMLFISIFFSIWILAATGNLEQTLRNLKSNSFYERLHRFLSFIVILVLFWFGKWVIGALYLSVWTASLFLRIMSDIQKV